MVVGEVLSVQIVISIAGRKTLEPGRYIVGTTEEECSDGFAITNVVDGDGRATKASVMFLQNTTNEQHNLTTGRSRAEKKNDQHDGKGKKQQEKRCRGREGMTSPHCS